MRTPRWRAHSTFACSVPVSPGVKAPDTFPKGTDLSVYSQRYLDRIALRLNTRPRKTLGYRTPAVTLAKTVASTG